MKSDNTDKVKFFEINALADYGNQSVADRNFKKFRNFSGTFFIAYSLLLQWLTIIYFFAGFPLLLKAWFLFL